MKSTRITALACVAAAAVGFALPADPWGLDQTAQAAPGAPVSVKVTRSDTLATKVTSEARTFYNTVLYTDGCERDFQAIYVGLEHGTPKQVGKRFAKRDVSIIPSKLAPGFSQVYEVKDGIC